jgi:hypothetical protein
MIASKMKKLMSSLLISRLKDFLNIEKSKVINLIISYYKLLEEKMKAFNKRKGHFTFYYEKTKQDHDNIKLEKEQTSV